MCGVLINCIFIINTFKSELIGVLLHGNIPKELNLTGLGYLFLENNNLSGEISERVLLESSSLELLDIGNNPFSNVIPDWIGNFSMLISLVFQKFF